MQRRFNSILKMDFKCETTHKLMYKLMYLRIKKKIQQTKQNIPKSNKPNTIIRRPSQRKRLSFVENISKPHVFVGMSQTC